MEAANFLPPTGEPYNDLGAGNYKAFEQLAELFETTTKRQAAVEHESGTTGKAVTTLLSAILLGNGLDAGNELLSAVRAIVFAALSAVAAAPDRNAALGNGLQAFQPESRENPLGVHRTTVDGMVPRLSRAEMDRVLGDGYREAMDALGEAGARSPRATLVIDDTSQRVASKHLSGAFSYINVGQRKTWERGFKYPSIYDATHQLFVGMHHADYRLREGQKRALRPWVQDLQAKAALVRAAGSAVAVFEGDREYFTGELFAAAYFGLLDPGAPPREQPRAVVPRKFTREKENFKWNYLLDPDSPQVFTAHVSLSPSTHPALRDQCVAAFARGKGGTYQVPYACVALADEYGREQPRTLAELGEAARGAQAGLDRCARALPAADAAYLKHYRKVAGRRGAAPGRGRGAKRTAFYGHLL